MCGDITIKALDKSKEHAFVEDHNSFEMQNMMVRTVQLLCITEATDSKIHIRKSGSETHDRAKNLVLSLKQYHDHYYWFYEKDRLGPQQAYKDFIWVMPFDAPM